GGQFATGRVLGERLTGAIVVPESAVRESDGSTYVFTVEDGVVVRRDVELGARDVTQRVVAIVSGLKAGDLVLSAPGAHLPAGTRVRLRSEAETGLDTVAGES